MYHFRGCRWNHWYNVGTFTATICEYLLKDLKKKCVKITQKEKKKKGNASKKMRLKKLSPDISAIILDVITVRW